MRFFSGFCFQNESELFRDYLVDGDFVVAGFSKGAIEAFEYAYLSNSRVDRLLLLSPAFFQTKNEAFKRLQLKAFKKDKANYIKNFYNSCTNSKEIDTKYKIEGSIDELSKLLYYQWDIKKIEYLQSKGVTIEVFLGSNDKIIDTKMALEFFKDICSTWYIKGVSHILM